MLINKVKGPSYSKLLCACVDTLPFDLNYFILIYILFSIHLFFFSLVLLLFLSVYSLNSFKLDSVSTFFYLPEAILFFLFFIE